MVLRSATESNTTKVPEPGNEAATQKRKCDYCRLGYRTVLAREVSGSMLCLSGGAAMATYTVTSWWSAIQSNVPREPEWIADGIFPAMALTAVTLGYAKISRLANEFVCTCKKD